MSAVIMEGQLAAALRSDQLLCQRHCQVADDAAGGVAITRRGHHIGLWRWHGGQFDFTPAGYGEPTIEVETVAEAVLVTRERFSRK